MLAYAGPLPDGQTETPRERAIAGVEAMARSCSHFPGLFPCVNCVVEAPVATDAEAFGHGRAFERAVPTP